ncbi:MAG: methyltransferase domain-containing protein [Nanoarchaeota archaeon]
MDDKRWDKIATQYFDIVSSPFDERVDNPLFDQLKKIRRRKQMRIIDLGCGIGNLTPFLSKHFGHVTAIDFSEKMVEVTGEKCKAMENVVVLKQDMRDLQIFYNQFDVAVAVNSFVLPSIIDIRKMFLETFKILKPGGKLIGIFPSINSDLYRAMLTFDMQYEETKKEDEAMKNTRYIMGEEDFDFMFGLYHYDGSQKHFYQFELEYRLKQAGFTNIVIDKVLYPWEMCEDDDLCNLEAPPLFDWFVTADKPA